MTRRLISTGSPFETAAAYSRAVVVGDMCFVAGTTGYDYTTMTMPEGAGAQTRNCLTTIAKTLEQAGFSLSEVVRATYYVTDIADADAVFAELGAFLGTARPAATLVAVSALYRPEMKVEIEITAKKG